MKRIIFAIVAVMIMVASTAHGAKKIETSYDGYRLGREVGWAQGSEAVIDIVINEVKSNIVFVAGSKMNAHDKNIMLTVLSARVERMEALKKQCAKVANEGIAEFTGTLNNDRWIHPNNK